MREKHKILQLCLVWTVRIVLGLALILLAASFIYIKTDTAQNKIRTLIDEKAQGYVEYERASLVILPRPGLVLHQINIDVPQGNSVAIESARIHPRLFSLLTGKVKIARVKFGKPDIILDISPAMDKKKPEEISLTAAEIINNISSFTDTMRRVTPGIILVVDKGRLILRENGHDVTDIKDLKARLALAKNDVRLRIRGDVEKWGSLSLAGRFYTQDNSLFVTGLSALFGHSSVSRLSGRLSFDETPRIEFTSAKTVLILGDIYDKLKSFTAMQESLRDVKELHGRIIFAPFNLSGPLLQPEKWNIEARGRVEGAGINARILPAPLRISRSDIQATVRDIKLSNVRASLFDTSLRGYINIEREGEEIKSIDSVTSGEIGAESLEWLKEKLNIPRQEVIRTPVNMTDTKINWEKGKKVSAVTTAQIKNGPELFIDLHRDRKELSINQLTVKDAESEAEIKLRYSKKDIVLSFKGNITEKTLNSIFEKASFRRGWVKGDMRVHVNLDQYGKTQAQGFFEGTNFLIPLPIKEPLIVKHASLNAKNSNAVNIKSGTLKWGENEIDLKGNISASRNGFRLDLDVITDETINIENIIEYVSEQEDVPHDVKPREDGTQAPSIWGIIRITSPALTWGRYIATPGIGEVIIRRRSVLINIKDALLCGVSIPGSVTIGRNDVRFDFKPNITGKELEQSLNCFLEKDSRITGIFDLNMAINSRAQAEELVKSMQGRVDFSAKEGTIYRFVLLARIFAVLNVTELLRGQLPDMATEGFNYNSFKIKGDIRDGIFVIEEAVLDGKTMQLVGRGNMNIDTNKINMTVLVAPFKTVDFLVSKIPVVRYILGGTLISIPVKVTGDFSDPTIVVLSPSAVGEGLFEMMKRTIMLPVKIIEPIIPKESKEDIK